VTAVMFVIKQNKLKIIFRLVKLKLFDHLDLCIVTYGDVAIPHLILAVIYFLCIMNDYSKDMWVFLSQDKSETFKCLVDFWSMLNTQFGVSIQTVRNDNGCQFSNGPLKEFFAEKEIIHETSCVDTPQQNGRVKCKNRHILNVARALKF